MAVELCIPKITDDEVSVLRDYEIQMKETTSIETATDLAFRFQHELAVLSGNTLMPLIISSFKVPIMSLWDRFCRLYGIDSFYDNTFDLYDCIEKRNAPKAVECLTTIINGTISGNRQIYY